MILGPAGSRVSRLSQESAEFSGNPPLGNGVRFDDCGLKNNSHFAH